MAQLVGLIVSGDDAFTTQVGTAAPLGRGSGQHHRRSARRTATRRSTWSSSTSAATTRRRCRRSSGCAAASPSAGIFAVALQADPDLILQSMRAGANEFFTWPPPEETFHGADPPDGGAARGHAGRESAATTLVFFGAKGGAGHDDDGGELRRRARAAEQAVDDHRRPQAGPRRGRAVPRRPAAATALVDALDNLHRLDREFLRELVVKHKSGLEILAGSDHFDRPGARRRRRDRRGVPAARRGSTSTSSSTPAARSTPCAVAALYTADTMFLVANPDVPSVRNAQRLLDRVRQLGACGERVRMLLNRAAEPYPIPPKQIESALGHPIHHTFPSDYKTVSTALNSGVPLALTGNSEHRGAVRQLHAAASSIRSRRGRIAAARASAAGSASSASRPCGNPMSSSCSRPPASSAPLGAARRRVRIRRRASSTSSCGPTFTASC